MKYKEREVYVIFDWTKLKFYDNNFQKYFIAQTLENKTKNKLK